jgi:hypothetical protein
MSFSRTQRRPRPALALLLLLLLGAVSGVLAQEKEAAEKEGKDTARAKTKEAKGTGKTAEEGDEAKPAAGAPPAPTTGLLAFGKMLPVGEQHKELEIPSFKNGAPSSMVQAKSMTRTDDENMFLERMNIWMYGPPGQAERDMRVQLRTATFHMPSSIVASDERSRISRSDFDLQGDSLIFDTATGQGKMVGNVRMVLHDASSFTKSAAEVSAEKEKEKTETGPAQGAAGSDAPASPASPTAGSQPADASTTPAGKPDTGTASPTNRNK